MLKGEGSIVTINETISFIERSRESKKPFLAVVWFGSPHEPYSGLPEDLALYDDLPQEYAGRKVSLTSMVTGRKTSRVLRDVLRERYAEITAMDRAIGQLRKHLRKAGIADNTMLWYCGDNGSPPSSGRVETPFRGQKATMYEGGIRVPGVIEWPARIKSPRSSSVSSVTSDMLPTLCALTGQSAPSRPIDGIDLTGLIDGKMDSRPTPICFWRYASKNVTGAKPRPQPYIDSALQEGTTPLVKYMAGKLTRSFTNYHQPPAQKSDYQGPRAIIDGNYKLVVDADGKSPIELFDLASDRGETTNLADEKPEVVADLSGKLKSWQDSALNSLRENDY